MKLRCLVVLACVFPALVWISAAPATASSTGVTLDQTWSLQSVPAPTASVETQLDSESCTGPDWCVAVGLTVFSTGEVPVVELWNGTIWSLGAFDTAGIATGALASVSCTSSSSCQAVGFYRSVRGRRSTALAESWNGTSWSTERLPSLRGDYLDGVSCVAAGSCTAVGFYVPHKNGIDVPLVERWNGTSWTKAEQVRDNNRWAGVQLFGVSCVSASDCMVVGVYSPMAETQYSLAESWNGTDWTITPTPPAPGALASFLTGVSCTSDGDCMTVGSYSASSAGPLVGLSESWRGSSWSLETVPGPAGADSSGLGSVSCISGTSCVGVGDSNGYGATLAESWNGENWAIESTPDPAGSPNVTLSSTSCVAGWCSAVGEYAPSTSSSDYLPFAADT